MCDGHHRYLTLNVYLPRQPIQPAAVTAFAVDEPCRAKPPQRRQCVNFSIGDGYFQPLQSLSLWPVCSPTKARFQLQWRTLPRAPTLFAQPEYGLCKGGTRLLAFLAQRQKDFGLASTRRPAQGALAWHRRKHGLACRPGSRPDHKSVRKCATATLATHDDSPQTQR